MLKKTSAEARFDAIAHYLNHLCQDKVSLLPKPPCEIIKVIDNLKHSEIIAKIKKDLPDFTTTLVEKKAEALVFEWNYDGGDEENIWAELSYPYRSCQFFDRIANTDKLNDIDAPSVELEPKLEEPLEENGGFCLDPVMNPWYADISPQFDDKFDEYDSMDEQSIKNLNISHLNLEYGPAAFIEEIQDLFTELFQLKLVMMLRTTVIELFHSNPDYKTEQLFHVYLQRHERWPMHVASFINGSLKE
ncbi:hypothetical protein [Aliikangiella sp. IMCC44359]|uniref:hypothetical protein n=1 Tax=Aliikangiella sp. IMCC44359 TaxID=3459125 RepID=UPI00403B3800